MKLSIRSIALLTILVPMLLPALGLSAWLTSLRVSDARAVLESRGERESRYLADASELALLVADSETLQRLAASTLKGAGAAVATLFLDADGAVLAAAGDPREVTRARQCRDDAAHCTGSEQRYLFQREVRASIARRDEAVAFSAAAAADVAPELIGRVLLSFDPQGLAAIQRAMLLNSTAITLGALLVAWALAHVVSRRLTVPMHRLSLVVARIRGGELAARTQPTGSGEMRELEDGVNAMA
ncbi:MAG: HAMP domain-containing protein, partial [Pseudomonadales bacterium]|nr:HAMP domain-containing protein [Pseudomonadales bacterium]